MMANYDDYPEKFAWENINKFPPFYNLVPNAPLPG